MVADLKRMGSRGQCSPDVSCCGERLVEQLAWSVERTTSSMMLSPSEAYSFTLTPATPARLIFGAAPRMDRRRMRKKSWEFKRRLPGRGWVFQRTR